MARNFAIKLTNVWQKFGKWHRKVTDFGLAIHGDSIVATVANNKMEEEDKGRGKGIEYKG
jgi:hypothetical protein